MLKEFAGIATAGVKASILFFLRMLQSCNILSISFMISLLPTAYYSSEHLKVWELDFGQSKNILK